MIEIDSHQRDIHWKQNNYHNGEIPSDECCEEYDSILTSEIGIVVQKEENDKKQADYLNGKRNSRHFVLILSTIFFYLFISFSILEMREFLFLIRKKLLVHKLMKKKNQIKNFRTNNSASIEIECLMNPLFIIRKVLFFLFFEFWNYEFRNYK